MNDFQAASVRRQVIRALRIAGAKPAKVMRKARDPNGMITGKTREIGMMYGVCYQPSSRVNGTSQIAMPGVTVQGGTKPRYMGVVIQGDPPRKGDCLCDQEGEKTLLETWQEAGVVYGLMEE